VWGVLFEQKGGWIMIGVYDPRDLGDGDLM
jgi:hypothetical protein